MKCFENHFIFSTFPNTIPKNNILIQVEYVVPQSWSCKNRLTNVMIEDINYLIISSLLLKGFV